ncbi:MAG: DUF4492 domain-containing protein [Desulfobulbus sp.]|jgi:hypothetical protein|uniref:DUF4492 domain-containing protein n=1 Tax=Desulfobulbus sp. TaxID=895 RepID=UPI0028492595|nr:DUF4492 domain-containing protein [Desulfobulbus sp.]MDR2551086.1 DUF4492 domain-containing protein [Desulfobulbus sp.]
MTALKTARPWIVTRIYRFYRDGFRQMTVGRTLWKIIFIKLFIMFAVLKFFFFPDFLATQFTTDAQRADYVIEQLTRSAPGYVQPVKGE